MRRFAESWDRPQFTFPTRTGNAPVERTTLPSFPVNSALTSAIMLLSRSPPVSSKLNRNRYPGPAGSVVRAEAVRASSNVHVRSTFPPAVASVNVMLPAVASGVYEYRSSNKYTDAVIASRYPFESESSKN